MERSKKVKDETDDNNILPPLENEKNDDYLVLSGFHPKSAKWKGKVLFDAKKDQAKKDAQKRAIKERHNPVYKCKDYIFPKKVNMQKFFWLPKCGMEEALSKSAMAIYPVLCSQANFEKDEWFQISQKNIGIRAGMSIKTVRTTLIELEKAFITDPSGISHPLLKKKKITGEITYYVYKVFFFRGEMGHKYKKDAILFHTCIIDSSIWQILKSRTKAVYLAMRSIAVYDAELHSLETDLDINTHSADFRDRIFDIIYPHQLGEICRIASTPRTGLSLILDELEEWGLIKYEEDDSIIVYLKPNNI